MSKFRTRVYADLARRLAREWDTKAPKHWKPFGRTTRIVDGTTFTMPGTPENLAQFQCHPNLKKARSEYRRRLTVTSIDPH